MRVSSPRPDVLQTFASLAGVFFFISTIFVSNNNRVRVQPHCVRRKMYICHYTKLYLYKRARRAVYIYCIKKNLIVVVTCIICITTDGGGQKRSSLVTERGEIKNYIILEIPDVAKTQKTHSRVVLRRARRAVAHVVMRILYDTACASVSPPPPPYHKHQLYYHYTVYNVILLICVCVYEKKTNTVYTVSTRRRLRERHGISVFFPCPPVPRNRGWWRRRPAAGHRTPRRLSRSATAEQARINAAECPAYT